jgi:hypothetical protein
MRALAPFRDGDLRAVLEQKLARILSEIEELESGYVLKASPTELEDFFVGKATIEPLTLHTDQAHLEDQSVTKVDVTGDFSRGFEPGERAALAGTRLRIAVPFDGDPQLWKLRPSIVGGSSPPIEVDKDRIIFSIDFIEVERSRDQIPTQFEGSLETLQQGVGLSHADVATYNRSLAARIRIALETRRKRALAALSVVEGLGSEGPTQHVAGD